MRVALLTMLEPSRHNGDVARAFLRIGGVTVARHQLALALALGCENIICLARAVAPEILELQHEAERAGARLRIVANPLELAGLVTAADEIVVLGDGLFVSTDDAAALLEQGQAVLIQPVEQGLSEGFERIDLNHAGAAAMRLPGRLIERIAELPADCDVVSALQRIALQAGVRQRSIPAPLVGGAFWTLIRDEDQALALEPIWIRQRTRENSPVGPSRAFARMGVRGLGASLLHAGSGSRAVAAAAGITALLGLGAGWLALPWLGLLLCAAAWVLSQSADYLLRIGGRERSWLDAPAAWQAFGWLLDGIVITLLGWASVSGSLHPVSERFFPPLMLVALLRIVQGNLPAKARVWCEDRALLALALAGASLAGIASEAAHLGAVVLALAGIAIARDQTRLTRP